MGNKETQKNKKESVAEARSISYMEWRNQPKLEEKKIMKNDR